MMRSIQKDFVQNVIKNGSSTIFINHVNVTYAKIGVDAGIIRASTKSILYANNVNGSNPYLLINKNK